MKLLVVDDEPIVRYGIRTSVAWEKYGVEWVGEAENGRTALQKAAQLQPDIVLCDIRMPEMDGIALIHALRGVLPAARVILLTGYADQEYLMEAIRCNVSDYLLKPAGMEQLLATVLRVKGEIETEREKMSRLQRRDELFNSNLSLLRNHLVTSLLAGSPDRRQLDASLTELGFSLDGPWYAVALLTGVGEGEWEPLRAFDQALKAFAPLTALDHGRNAAVALLNLPNGDPRAALAAAGTDCAAFAGRGRTLIVSDAAAGLAELPACYDGALALLDRREWYPEERVLFVEHRLFADAEPADFNALREQLLLAVHDGKTDDAARLAGRLFDSLASTTPPFRLFTDRLNQIWQAVGLAYGVPGEDAALLAGTPGALRERFVEVCGGPIDPVLRYSGGLVGRALRFMEKHYTEDLSLEYVAERLFISPTYLSRLLKEKTQVGFSGWLNDFRIRKAKKLLMDSEKKHYEIAEQTGYHSYKVFCEHFQQIAGMTAREYRDLYRKQGK